MYFILLNDFVLCIRHMPGLLIYLVHLYLLCHVFKMSLRTLNAITAKPLAGSSPAYKCCSSICTCGNYQHGTPSFLRAVVKIVYWHHVNCGTQNIHIIQGYKIFSNLDGIIKSDHLLNKWFELIKNALHIYYLRTLFKVDM